MASARERVKSALGLAPFALPAAALAYTAIARVYAKTGHGAATLDDAYIHFQYARAFAEGHALRYQAGEPFTSGATSLLWPAALAPFWLLGLRDTKIVWAAWILSFVALGALAYEVHRLTRRLAGPYGAIGAAAMVFASSGLVWCAASGMEVVPLAWMITRTVRVASEWAESEPVKRTPRARRELLFLAAALPLLRPEGAIFSLFVAATLARHPREPTWTERRRALYALIAPVALPLLLWLATGSVRSSTVVVKLLPGNPYYPPSVLWPTIVGNARVFVGTLLNGQAWAQEFLPQGGAPIWMGGLAAIAALGVQRRARWRAGGVLLVALVMFVPCAYDTFLWNRLRYLWPFFPGWIIGAACAAEFASDLLSAVKPRWKLVGPILCGLFAGALAMRLDFALDDVAESASGIDRQQATLGRWASRELPESARIGVNDTGAIAYFSNRHTFDVVGLTTAEEARYWVAGPASRLEHYEVLARTSPARLPTHFIVYPEWLGCDAVLGEVLTEAVVRDATILGGQTMRAYVADYSNLGSGEKPWSHDDAPTDDLDVADLESEALHGYELLGALTGEQVSRVGNAPDGRVVVDGGRGERKKERFVARVRPGAPATLIARVEAHEPTHARVHVEGVDVGVVTISADDWTEVSLPIPVGVSTDRLRIEIDADAPITTYHYWVI